MLVNKDLDNFDQNHFSELKIQQPILCESFVIHRGASAWSLAFQINYSDMQICGQMFLYKLYLYIAQMYWF